MIHLHFNLAIVQFFADHRVPALTSFFRLMSLLGTANFYILIVILLYVAYDKRVAIRLSILVLVTITFNDILKLFIANPRPYVVQGTCSQHWAVSPSDAHMLAAEYSTPSGHAMGSSAFYLYLFGFTRSRFVRAICILLIVLIGVSRPYLGVHYVEDVLFGWVIGLVLAIAAIRFGSRMAAAWAACSHGLQIALTVAASLVTFGVAMAIQHGHIDAQVSDITAYCGFLTGIVIACPLEMKLMNFSPRSSGVIHTLLRYAISVFLMVFVLFTLKDFFRSLAPGESVPGCALEYLRYVAADVAAMLLAPFIFSRLRWAESSVGTEQLSTPHSDS